MHENTHVFDHARVASYACKHSYIRASMREQMGTKKPYRYRPTFDCGDIVMKVPIYIYIYIHTPKTLNKKHLSFLTRS